MMKLSWWLIALSLIWGCKPDEPPLPADPGLNYFPIDTGLVWVYLADSVIHNDFTGTTDTVVFYLKDSVAELFNDLGSRKSYRVESFTGADTLSWQPYLSWHITPEQNWIEAVLGGERQVPFIFPPVKGKEWNFNSMNSRPELLLEIEDVNQKFVLENQMNFDSTVMITAVDTGNLIEKQLLNTVYARHVGLVYKKAAELETGIDGSVISGYSYRQQLINYRP